MTYLPRQAFVLAAGLGSRLYPLTEHLPKCLVEIDGVPVLEHVLAHLGSYGVSDVVVNVHHLSEVVMRAIGDGSRFGISITWSHEPQLLGTAGAVAAMRDHFFGQLFVWYGDNRCGLDLVRIHAIHRATTADVTMAVHERDDVTQSGVVDVEPDGTITRIVEKPAGGTATSRYVNAGVYLLERDVVDRISRVGRPDFARDVFPAELARGSRLVAVPLLRREQLRWIDTPADLERERSSTVVRREP